MEQRQVLHLFERVGEPIYIPKSGGQVQYQVPDRFVPAKHKNTATSRNPQAGEERRIVFQIDPNVRLPAALNEVQKVRRGGLCSLFVPNHRQAAYALVDIFMGVPTVKELVDLAAVVRDRVNEDLFVFAWAAALIRRPDTRNLRVPPVWEIFPDKFVEATIVNEARKQVQHSPDQMAPIVVNRTFAATDRVVENRVAYFREDLGVNSHHWHWHLVYPLSGTRRDRRGELFYYMHQQMLARYDLERIANGLSRVVPFHNWDQPISEAYFPKLTSSNAGLNWAGRPAGMTLRDLAIPDEGETLGLELQVNDLERWRTRILHAIHQGIIIRDGTGEAVVLDEERGIDILGDVIEASDWSINRSLYGDLHNFGHMALAFIHDPDNGHRENMGVMGDTSTAMRDPIFYRWHKFIDDLFQQFKASLQPYSTTQLTLPGIQLKSIETVLSSDPKVRNVLRTGWQESVIEMSRGLDFSSTVPVQVKYTHIQHEDFKYQIYVSNTSGTQQELVLRIFLGPVRDHSGRVFSLREQRQLMVEMDKFVTIVPPGTHMVSRSASVSSISIPFERTFRQLEQAQPLTAGPGTVPVAPPTDDQQNYCGCGWPHHLLVPRGTPGNGMPMVLFAMATSWKEDYVSAPAKKSCQNAVSYCGILDQKYPDRKPMGYPFDRPPQRLITNLAEFLTPNMTTAQVAVQFQDRVIQTFP